MARLQEATRVPYILRRFYRSTRRVRDPDVNYSSNPFQRQQRGESRERERETFPRAPEEQPKTRAVSIRAILSIPRRDRGRDQTSRGLVREPSIF